MTKPLPNRIRELREAKGLTQAELARRIGTSQQAIYQAEVHGYIGWEKRLEIAKVLGVRPEELSQKNLPSTQ